MITSPQALPHSTSVAPGATVSQLADLLTRQQCALLFSTIGGGRLYWLHPDGAGGLNLGSRTFPQCLGIAVEGDQLAVASGGEVTLLRRFEVGREERRANGDNDTHWIPRLTYYTGHLQMHDLHFGRAGLWGINTAYSCIGTIDAEYSFRPRWRPSFVEAAEPEDYCHLNGMAMEAGEPRYVTAFSARGHWRKDRHNGVVIDLATDRCLVDGLSYPHSPRLYEGELYVLVSGTGELLRIDRQTGVREVLLTLPGFPRGIVRLGEYLLIGISQLRDSNLLQGRQTTGAQLALVHRPSHRLVGILALEQFAEAQLYGFEEIYELQLLPQTRCPQLVNPRQYLKLPAFHQGLFLPSGPRWNRK
ncbi:MAG: TIGR03032 family protein [Bacteroidota bacterium]